MFDSLAPYLPLVLLVAAVVVILALARRIPVLRWTLSLATWVLIGWLLVTMIGERGQFDPYLGRLARLVRLDQQQVAGGELRIPLSPDGHFWARARINGIERRLLIDSGATVTAISVGTATAAGLTVRDPVFPIVLTTANGSIRAKAAAIELLTIGEIEATNLAAVVSPAFGDTDVLGMNFLSKLKSWRVEGGTLILVPTKVAEG